MPAWKIAVISLIPLYGFLGFLLLEPLLSWILREGYVKECVRTKHFLASPAFGLVTYVCGNIGAGKTTCASGICNTLALVKEDQAMKRMADIRDVFRDTDFNQVDRTVAFAFRNLHMLNTNRILAYLLEGSPELRRKTEGKYFDTSLYPESMVSLLRDYIEADLALLRNSYVYSLGRMFYCWPTDSWAMDYDASMIDIRDRHLAKDYSLLRYATVFEDEKVLSGKVSTNFQKVAKEDGGGDTFFRLIRHLGKGTVHYISTSQDFGRVVKSERELATGIFYVRKREELHGLSLKSLLCRYLEDVLRRWQMCILGFSVTVSSYRLRKYSRLLVCFPDADSRHLSSWKGKIERYSSDPTLRPSRLSLLVSRLRRSEAREFADGFVSYRGIYYTCASDVGKEKSSAVGEVLSLDLVFPLRWCYGSVDTYCFSVVHDYLVNESTSRRYDSVDFSDDRIPWMDDDAFERFVSLVLDKNSAKSGRPGKGKNVSPEDGPLPFD